MDKKKLYTQYYRVANFVIAFLALTILHGLYVNFKLPNWLVMLFAALASFALSFWLYKNCFYAAVVCLIITQVFWTLLFWPVNCLTIGAVLLVVYYTIWEIKRRRKIKFNLLFALTALILLLITSKWLPN